MKSNLQHNMEIILNSLNIDYEKEYRFHPVRKWRIDFALVDKNIAIECEGGVYIKGRHNRASGFIKDVEKYNALTLAGWRLLRFTIKDFKQPLSIINTIKELINEKHIFKPDKETLQASREFIKQIKSGEIKKRIIQNTSSDFDINKASESFDNFIESDDFQKILNE